MTSRVRSLLLFCVVPTSTALLMQPAGFSQGIQTGSISGTTVDASGAILPNAQIALTDRARGTTFNTTSQSDGVFAIRALPIGTYKVTITAPGFKTTEIEGLGITTGSDTGIGKQTLTAGAADTVTVEAASTVALDTTTSQVSATFDVEQLERLPLNNGFDQVALLTPGVVPTHDVNFSNTNGVGFSSNGLRGRSNNFELDGQSNNDNSVSGPQIFFGNQDAIAEIQVIQSNFSAQYGRNTGSVVNYVTKTGTNSIHGSAFELYTGSFLNSYSNQYKSSLFGYCTAGQDPNATGCSPVQRLPRSVDNKYGGTLGFPIIKDKLFGFASTYYQHTRNGASPFNSGAGLTPTPAGLTALAALFPNSPAVAVLQNFGPYGVKVGNPQPVMSGASTVKVTSPAGVLTDIQVAPLTRTAPSGNYTDQEQLGRLDYQATSKDRFYLRYLYQKNLSSNNPDNGAGGTFYDVPDATHSVGSDWTHSFSSRWINQLRYSFQQSKLDFQSGSFPNCTVNTLTACPGNVTFLSGTDLGFGQATNLPQGRTVKVTQVQDNVSFSFGKQTILFGGEFDYQNSPNIFLPNYNGTFLPAGLDAFLHQTGNYNLSTGNPVLPFKEKDYALYLQDDYKVSSSLTVNLGLRWEFFGQAVNTLNDITTKRESNPATAIWNTALPLSVRTTPKVKNAYKNFEPRLGFAFNPSFDKKLVIRGAYSMGFDPAFYNLFLNFATAAPSAITANIGCGGNCLGTGNFTGAANRANNLSKLPVGGDPAMADQEFVPANFHNPYVQTYSFGVEHSLTSKLLMSVRYVGNHGVGNFQSVDSNPYLAPVKAAFPNAAPGPLCTTVGAVGIGRPNCKLGNVSYVANSAFSIYNSLQIQATTRSLLGFTGSVNYTYSKTIDNSSEVYSSGAGGSTISVPQNPLNNNTAERGNSATSYPNVLSVGMVYRVPSFKMGNSLVRKALNGFNINSLYQYTSGQPFNLFQPNLDQYAVNLTPPTLDNPNPPPYQLNPSYCDGAFNSSSVGPGADTCRLVLGNKSAPLNTVSILAKGKYYDLGSLLNGGLAQRTPDNAHWIINNTDYANVIGNPYGGSGRNILRAQNYNNLDASVFKDTRLTERINLELQVSSFNVLNRQFRGTPLANAFYDNGGSDVSNPFLSNGYNNSNNRSVQFGAKVQF